MATISQYVMHFTNPDVAPFVVNPYTSNGPTFPVTLSLDATASNARTSLLYYGKGHPNYGERLEENFMHLLESFSGSIAPTFAVSGQLWFDRAVHLNTSTGWYKWIDDPMSVDNGSWTVITVNLAAPPGTPVDGVYYFNAGVLYFGVDISGHPLPADWYSVSYDVDTSLAVPSASLDKPKKHLRVYDGTDWRLTNTAWASSNAPGDPQPGDLWFDTGTQTFKVYNGTSWVSTAGNFVSKTGDTMTGTLVMSGAQINMSNNKIINLATPTVGGDATNKTYVDTAIAAAVSGISLTLNDLTDVTIAAPSTNQYLRYNAGTWVNSSILVAHIFDMPATITELSYLSGVTSSIQAQLNTLSTTKLNLSGGTMTGVISMGGNKITNLAAPTVGGDAVNLSYFTANDKYISAGSLDGVGTLTLNRSDLVNVVVPGFALASHSHEYTPESNELLSQLVLPPAEVTEAVHALDKVVRRRTHGYKSVETSTGSGTYPAPKYEVESQRLMVFNEGLKLISSTRGYQRVNFTLTPGGSPISTPEQLECFMQTGLQAGGSPAATYEATVTIDGGAPQVISITGGTLETTSFCLLVDEINAQLTGAVAILEDTSIVIMSDTVGATSTVLIVDGSGSPPYPLFGSMDYFSSISSAVAGADYDYEEVGSPGTTSTSVIVNTTSVSDTIEFVVLGGTGVP